MASRWRMRVLRYSLAAAVVPFVHPASTISQQKQSGGTAQEHSTPNADGNIPTLRSTTTLVFLDVTVLDKQGHPVVKGLAQQDFTITEDRTPQRIFSFEDPGNHEVKGEQAGATKTILVLDLLNTSFADFAYVREQARQFLQDQPNELRSETELLVEGNQTLEPLHGFTRSREDLLFALSHLPRRPPYKLGPGWKADRIRQSYRALQQIAAQNQGVPGRKNVIWIGSGSPNLPASEIPGPEYDKVQLYVRRTVNMMVEARITLFLVYPRLNTGNMYRSKQARDLISGGDSSNPFAESNFAKFVYETGGKVFDLNDVGREIGDSALLGSNYYTLTYQPKDDKVDGGFRRIQVKLRNPELNVVTKAGFFTRDPKEQTGTDDQTVNMLMEAALATIPMEALQVNLVSMVRHPDAQTLEMTVQLDDSKFGRKRAEGGLRDTAVILSAVSRSAHGDMLASRVAKYSPTPESQGAANLDEIAPEIKFTLGLPSGTRNVRVAVAIADGGRVGSLDLSRKDIDAAPTAPTPDPKLLTSQRAAVMH